MVAFTSANIKLIPPAGALLAGGAVLATAVLLPSDMIDGFAWNSGISALIPAAAPPLGVTARTMLGTAGCAIVAMIVWSALYLLFGEGGVIAPRRVGEPVVRRADAHPDAPPRRPMSAADLGVPLMEVGRPMSTRWEKDTTQPALPRNQALPKDQEPTLANFDPAAFVQEDRIEMFALTPVVRKESGRPPPAPPATIDALLQRLEEGAARRASQGR